MKPHYQPLTSILLAFTLLCGLSSYSSAQQATWKITSLEWEPYSSSSMNNSGNAIQHLRSMLAQCDILGRESTISKRHATLGAGQGLWQVRRDGAEKPWLWLTRT